jgi:multidrug resistance protein
MDEPKVRRALRLIFLIMLMDIMGLTLLYPVLPYLVQRYSNNALMVTATSALYAAAQFFAAPLLGKLGDRYGRRPVLLISVLGSVIGYIMFGVGGALWVLFLSRLIDGITGGNLSTASAYIADVSKPEERARNFTLIGLAWGLGLILGPALGSIFGQINFAAPAFAAAGFSALNFILGYFMLPESLPPSQRETAPIRLHDLNPMRSIGEVARKYNLSLLLLALCLFNLAFNGINSIQTVFMIEKFKAEPFQVGALLVLAGVVMVAVQGTLVNPVTTRYGNILVAVFSLLGQACAATMIFFLPTFGLVFVFSGLSSAFSVFTFPTLTALTANRVPPQEQGALMGASTALGSLMSILGPLWAGTAYDTILHGSPYWIGAAIYVLAALLLLRCAQEPRRATQ